MSRISKFQKAEAEFNSHRCKFCVGTGRIPAPAGGDLKCKGCDGTGFKFAVAVTVIKARGQGE